MGERVRVVIIFVVWAALSLLSLTHHEAWRDEADPWLYARDAPFFLEFFSGGRYSGTPLLWHLIQVPFARAGAPYAVQLWLHWFIAAAAMWIFIAHARVSLWLRAVFSVSFFAVFEYAVVARSYSLTMLFLMGALAAWPARRQSPWFFVCVGLLSHTNIPGMIFAGALGLLGVVVRTSETTTWRFYHASIAAAVTSYVLAILQVLPPEDGQKTTTKFNPDAFVQSLREGIFPSLMGDSTQVLVSGALFVLAVLTLLRHRVALAFFVLVVTGFGVLYTFVHAGALRHWGFYQVALVAAVWLAAHQGTKTSTLMGRLLAVAPTIAAVLILIPWGYRGLDATRREVNERFSNAPAMARFIREQGLHTRTIAMHVEAIAVVPWLPEMKPWYPSIESSTSYLPWNTRQAQTRGMSGIELARRTTRKFRGDDSVLLLVRVQLKEEDARRYDWQLLHVEEVPTWFYNGEKLYLYQRASSAMKRLNHQQ